MQADETAWVELFGSDIRSRVVYDAGSDCETTVPDIESSIQLVEVDATNKIYYIEMGYYGHNHDPKSC